MVCTHTQHQMKQTELGSVEADNEEGEDEGVGGFKFISLGCIYALERSKKKKKDHQLERDETD